MRAERKLLEWMPALAAVLLIAGCSGEKPAAAPSAAQKAGPSAAAAALQTAAAAQAPASPHRSKFTAAGARDPFFPKKGPSVSPPGGGQTESAGPTDAVALLRAGFQGTIGSGADRLGLINNIILETGRTATIPLNAPGQKREVTVKVRQVLPNAVILDIPGQPQPVTITRTQR